MTPRRAAPNVLAAAGLVAVGWWVGVAVHRRASEEAHIRLYRRLLVAEANQDQSQAVVVLERFIAAQHDYIEQLEHELAIDRGTAVVAEAEQILAEGDGS